MFLLTSQRGRFPLRDPIVRHFFTAEFGRYSKSFKQEVIAPIQNKIGQLLMTPVIRNILGQSTSKLDLRYAIDHHKIIIANLAKGQIGDDKANLLGSLLVAGIGHQASNASSVSAYFPIVFGRRFSA